MATSNIEKLRVYSDIFNGDGMTDENSLSRALLTQPDLLSPVLTHLAGREDKRFPLSFLTEGMGRVRTINDIEYDYPVMGRINKAVPLAVTNGSTTPGIGRTRAKLVFAERWFVRQYVLESPRGVQVRIQEDPVQTTDGNWEYTVQLLDPDPAAFIPSGELTAGTLWASSFAPVAASGSRGNESNWVAPSKMKNQITHVRKSYRYEGNMPDRVVNIEFPLPMAGGSTKLWYDFEEWQHMLRWKEECESSYWYSEYNRDKNGLIYLKDDNGKDIPIGSGVLEQIPNVDSYGKLTAKKLKNVVRDALYGATDAQDTNVVMFTGTGGLEEFDNAMKEELNNQTYIKLTDSRFVSGSGRNLTLGGFFTSYQHIDGHTITVRQLPLFDHGHRALNSPKHPETGLPLESYRMVFLDMSTYDGQANVGMVTQKGREMLRWAVAGATVPKGFEGNALRATDVDGASVHFMKASGIYIRRATNCMHLTCDLV
jgi:hypothetical protein